MQTIFAFASGLGSAAIGVFRLSGPQAGDVLDRIAGPRPMPRQATLRVCRGSDGGILDQSLLLWFPAPASFTGEDCAEIHIHGGSAVREAVSRTLIDVGCRPAEPGEFSRRAFLNGKMDLLQAEGIADLVAAETDAQREMALRQVKGAESRALESWAGRLKRLLAWQEALIDFPDEDLPAETHRELTDGIQQLHAELDHAAQGARRSARTRDGVTIAIVGPPNAGKSSLVNALSGRDVAITSDQPGTTRDVIEVWTEIAGVGVTLVDTAGLRDSSDPVEVEGVRRAQARAESADLVLDIAAPDASPGFAEVSTFAERLLVFNKCDLAPAPADRLAVSATRGEGLEALRTELARAVERLTATTGDPALGRARHRAALEDAARHLAFAARAHWPELRGEELRLALQALGRITGAVGVEDILDTVFNAFCIGK